MTLLELSNHINANGGWYTDQQDSYIDIIKQNGWKYYEGSDLDLCSDGKETIIFDPDEEGQTFVVHECFDNLHE